MKTSVSKVEREDTGVTEDTSADLVGISEENTPSTLDTNSGKILPEESHIDSTRVHVGKEEHSFEKPVGGTPQSSKPRQSMHRRNSIQSSFTSALTWSQRVSLSLRSKIDKHYSKLFGNEYSKKEGTFVLIAGGLMAFNSGFINASCVSGLLTNGRSQSVTGYTSAYTKSAMAVAGGDWEDLSFPSGLILSYMLGAFIASLFTPRAKSYRIEPSYGPTFLVGGVFMVWASIFAGLEKDPNYVFCLVAAANGIQNGIASIYSANLIRCSLTGSTTDLALFLAQVMRGNSAKFTKTAVIGMIVLNFWLGGLVSFYFTRRFLARTLFFNAVLFWLIGVALVAFLVKEIGISVQAAILGNWEWKRVLRRLQESGLLHDTTDGGGGIAVQVEDGKDNVKVTLVDMFDEIDVDNDGYIEHNELLEALLNKTNMKVSSKMVKLLIRSADANGDGLISRDEWTNLIEKIQSSSTNKRTR